MHAVQIIKKYWQNGAISFVIISGVFIYLLKISWLKWGDLIIDSGTEMYLPLEILSGKFLYRDIYYYHGPFGPYFNALLYKIFGIHLHSLILSGIIAAAAATFLAYKIARIFLNTLFSTFTALTFLVVFAFGQYVYLANYNYILPFSYDAVYSIVFSLSALYFFNFLIRKGNLRFRYYIILFTTITLLSKIEVGVGLIFSLLAGLIIYRVNPVRDRLPKATVGSLRYCISNGVKNLFWDMFFYAFIPLSLSFAVYFLLLGSLNINNSFLEPFLFNTDLNNGFTRFVFGLHDFPMNLKIFAFSLTNYLFLTVLFVSGGVFLSWLDRRDSVYFKKLFKAVSALIIISLGIVLTIKFFFYDWQYRPLPVLLLAVVSISIFRSFKVTTPEAAKEAGFLFSISAFSFFLVFRMLFFARAAHYGFYLLAPGMIVYHIFFLKLIPEAVNVKKNNYLISAGFLSAFIIFIAWHWAVSSYCYKNRTYATMTPRGTIYTFDDSMGNNNRLLIDYIINNTPKDSQLVVFPEGITVNFLSQRRNPLRLLSYIPTNLLKAGRQEEIVAVMEREKIDYAVINQRNTLEFGYAVFGRDYGKPIWEYIKNNYELEKEFGPFPYTTNEFGIALFKRKEPAG